MQAKITTVLGRGLRRRCPHCGRGRLFRKGVVLHERCAVCNLEYVRNAGDPWAFLLIVDRACFVLPVVAGIYFGVLTGGGLVLVLFFGSIVVSLMVTTPHRCGLCVALDYLTRRYWGDPADHLPPPPDERPNLA